MTERNIVDTLVSYLRKKGYLVTTEVANFHRSADVAAITDDDEVILVECKLYDISRAIKQAKTHKLTAEKVYICTKYRNTRRSTIDQIKSMGIGLIYVMPDKTIKIVLEPSNNIETWTFSNDIIKTRIKDSNYG